MNSPLPEYHNNPSQRTPCVLVLDASGSMTEVVPGAERTRIDELNSGLAVLQQELMKDETAAMRVQLSIVCVGGPAGGADVLMDWTDAVDFRAPQLRARGLTPLGAGMQLALGSIERQKATLKQHGIGYTRPWIMVISDGEPTDPAGEWQAATQACRAAESAGKCIIFPIAVENANVQALQQLSTTPAMRLAQARFREYFQWLSSSLSSGSRSRPGAQIQLPSTNPWAAVST